MVSCATASTTIESKTTIAVPIGRHRRERRLHHNPDDGTGAMLVPGGALGTDLSATRGLTWS
jgi:hypothetical protein